MSKYEQRGAYHYEAFNKQGDPYREHVLDLCAEIYHRIDIESTVLDVGAGEGLVIDELTYMGYHCLGCELDQHAVDIASRKGNPVIRGTISRFSGWRFDIVMALDVLEHVGDPVDLFRRMSAMADKALVVALPSKDDPHAVNAVTIDDLAHDLQGRDTKWKITHRETRHARHFAIFERVADSDAVREEQTDQAIDALSQGGSDYAHEKQEPFDSDSI